MPRNGALALCAGLVLAGGIASADNPDCETFAAEQPDQMITNVLLVYTWDSSCGADPVLGPVGRDGEAIGVAWDQDLGVDPHEHTAWDNGLEPGVHSYDLTVTVDGQEPYVLDDSLLVAGTAPAQDASPDSGGDGDTDADSDGDSDEDDDGSSGGGGGCAVAPTSGSASLFVMFSSLLVALVG
jgi:hypothetical protein